MVEMILGEGQYNPEPDLVLKILICRIRIRPNMDRIRNPALHNVAAVWLRRSGSSCSDYGREDGIKKAKIGITIKKSPNSDRTFESRLLDQELDDAAPVLKNKRLEIW